MNHRGRRAFAVAVCLLGACAERPKNGSEPVSEWPHYGQSQAGLRYSPLTQITPANVGDLEIAWMYRIGGLPKIQGLLMPALEATPIVADGRMFLCSSTNKVVALDPETGARALDSRSEDQARRPDTAQLSRRHLFPRRKRASRQRLRRAHLHGNAGCAAARRSMPRPASPAPASASAVKSISRAVAASSSRASMASRRRRSSSVAT